MQSKNLIPIIVALVVLVSVYELFHRRFGQLHSASAPQAAVSSATMVGNGDSARPLASQSGVPRSHALAVPIESLPERSSPIAQVYGKSHEATLSADRLGNFPRVYIQAKQKVLISLHFPQGHPNDSVSIRVEDGGLLDKGAAARVLPLDSGSNVQFHFQASEDPGIYHVVVRDGADDWTFNFWVGPQLPMAKR